MYIVEDIVVLVGTKRTRYHGNPLENGLLLEVAVQKEEHVDLDIEHILILPQKKSFYR
jgi:hypothetical protein